MTRLSSWLKATSILILLATVTLASTLFQQEDDLLDSFELAEGFQIELVASEPHVADPVAMEIDENGTIYVAEMPGYPLDVSGKGRIRVLRDTNGDGLVDASQIFAEDIVLPTGLMRWKQGLLVTAPPDVLYLEDADNDGKAESREVVLTGFARSNPQHNFNKPMYGLDNWIYMANNGIIWTSAYKEQFGGRGEEVYFPKHPENPRLGKNANDRNVRFKPDSFEMESLAGRSQFGHTFDAYGHHFLTSNATPQFHEVIAAQYLARNPSLNSRMAMQYTPAYGRNTAIYPITKDPEHQLLTDRGMITSAAGITYYLGGLFPEPYNRSTFIGEPVHNLVHVLKVAEKGATFESSRVEERKEFLASTDSWFRPVNFHIGPDGALYVVDYNRQIVEHPEWMDEETAKSGKLKNGTERGRIYRITPTGTAPANWIGQLNLADAPSDSLVSHLQSPNIWWRLTAQRLLLDRQDANAVDTLENLLNLGATGVTRLHALWTLDGLGKITPQHIETALRDAEAGVRENAIKLAETHANQHPQLWDTLLAMEMEPNARVRFQLLCTLGFLDTDKSKAVRQALLQQDIEDEWMQLAALTTYEQIDYATLSNLWSTLTATSSTGRAEFIKRIASLIAANSDHHDINRLMDTYTQADADTDSWWQEALLAGIAAGLPRTAQSEAALVPVRNTMLEEFERNTSTTTRAALLDVMEKLPTKSDKHAQKTIKASKKGATAESLSAMLRSQNIRLLARLDAKNNVALFKSLINQQQPISVQQAAIQAYSQSSSDDLSEVLISKWPALTPDVRNTALDVLMRNQAGMQDVLEAVEAGIIQASALGWNRTVILMRDTQGAVKEKARMLLSEPAGVRDEVVASYYESLSLDGDLEQGLNMFKQACASCHQVGGEHGVAFGPDLGTVRHWSAKALLAKILKPQSTIADGYGLWSVETKDAVTEVGLINTASPGSIVLRQQGGIEKVIPREDVANLRSLNATAMPAGLEAQISKQEMANLIAYLRFN